MAEEDTGQKEEEKPNVRFCRAAFIINRIIFHPYLFMNIRKNNSDLYALPGSQGGESSLEGFREPGLLKENFRRIAIFRALQLGDMLCSVPALRALRSAFPHSEITLIGLPWSRDFISRFHSYFDRFTEFPGFPSLPERKPEVSRFPGFIKECQKRRFDLALQLHGDGSILNTLLPLLNARRYAGFFKAGNFTPEPAWFMPWPSQGHEILRLLKLMVFLGIPLKGQNLEFPLTPQDHRDLRQMLARERVSLQSFACLHPGAQVKSKRWLPERFAQVADRIYEWGYDIVLTGTAQEQGLTRKVASFMRHSPYDFTGKTTLGCLAALLKRSRLVICNDTGISHMAAALGKPSIVVVTGSDPDRWAPLDRYQHKAIFHPVDCRPCTYSSCPFGQPCAEHVTVPEVLQYAESILLHKRKGLF